MGLDQYLECEVKLSNMFIERGTDEDVKDDAHQLRNLLDDIGVPADNTGKGNYGSIEITVHAGYWRKANAIHGWFVREVQHGEDDCGRYHVTLDKLHELRDLCKQVITAAKVEQGQVRTSTTFVKEDGSDEVTVTEHYDEGVIVANAADLAEKLLPTRGGFFFGNTAYTAYYLQTLGHTVDVIDACEKSEAILTDRGLMVAFYYHSSW